MKDRNQIDRTEAKEDALMLNDYLLLYENNYIEGWTNALAINLCHDILFSTSIEVRIETEKCTALKAGTNCNSVKCNESDNLSGIGN